MEPPRAAAVAANVKKLFALSRFKPAPPRKLPFAAIFARFSPNIKDLFDVSVFVSSVALHNSIL